jgi:anhydro-N-acetylmuramic acid kinase
MSDARMSDSAVYVGLMSGTSLDGISAAAVRFTDRVVNGRARINAELLTFVQADYTPAQRARLLAGMDRASAQEYCRLHGDLGDWLADAALDVMQRAALTPADVRAVASHGQTLWHEVGHSTWQIGDPARIAERTGCAVVSDFRARDMAVGGQGAPLVPMADGTLFAHDTAWRALQNVGGIGNVGVVPPRDVDAPVQAFDTGPGAVITDGVVQRLFGQAYDRDGVIAAQGRILDDALRGLLDLPYYREVPPKSTGRELYTPAFIDDFIAHCRTFGASDADIVATSVGYTAATIAGQYALFVTAPISEVLLSGGGSKHPLLPRALEGAFAWHHARSGYPVPAVRRFHDVFFDAEAKEAVAFALLGHLHLTGRAGNVPSATGARAARVLGSLTPANRVELKS